MISKTIAAAILITSLSATAYAFQAADPFAPQSPAAEAEKEKAATRVPVDVAPAEASAEEQINAALSEETSFDFYEQPLTDVLEFLRNKHRINAQMDVAGLDLAGVSPEDQVTKSLSGVSLRSALRLMLNDLDLTYVIRDEVLQITSVEAAESVTATKIYDVSTILDTFRGDIEEDFPEMLKRIIDPESWTREGQKGIGDVVAMSFGNERHLLIVNQTRANHEAIENLIEELQKKVK